MKLNELVNSREELAAFTKCSLPIGIAWELKLFAKKLIPELNTHEEMRVDLVKKNGQQNENNPDKWSVKPENMILYFKELKELGEREIDIELPKVSIAELKAYKDKDGNGISISTDDLLKLDWLIK